MRVRPPSLINLQVLPEMVKGRLIADVVACIASVSYTHLPSLSIRSPWYASPS